MRIIAGTAKGTVLFSPADEEIRPTSDRAKESLFNILMPRIIGSTVLDLFCGSGALGLEALSRGALKAIFVDGSSDSLDLAKKNATKTKLMDRGEFLLTKLPKGLQKVSSRKFDLIFADPPYEKGLAEAALLQVSELDLLAPEGWLILEHDRKEDMPLEAGFLKKFREKKIGKSKFSFYQFEK